MFNNNKETFNFKKFNDSYRIIDSPEGLFDNTKYKKAFLLSDGTLVINHFIFKGKHKTHNELYNYVPLGPKSRSYHCILKEAFKYLFAADSIIYGGFIKEDELIEMLKKLCIK